MLYHFGIDDICLAGPVRGRPRRVVLPVQCSTTHIPVFLSPRINSKTRLYMSTSGLSIPELEGTSHKFSGGAAEVTINFGECKKRFKYASLASQTQPHIAFSISTHAESDPRCSWLGLGRLAFDTRFMRA